MASILLVCGGLSLLWEGQPRADLSYPGALPDPSYPSSYYTSDSYDVVVAWYKQRFPAICTIQLPLPHTPPKIRISEARVSRGTYLPALAGVLGYDGWVQGELAYHITDCRFAHRPFCVAEIEVLGYPGCDQNPYGITR